MTKVTILGQEPKEKELKKIAVSKMLLSDGNTANDYSDLSNYSEISILKVAGFDNFDCIVKADNCIFLAKFNDGIV